jgi:hypothetical protein
MVKIYKNKLIVKIDKNKNKNKKLKIQKIKYVKFEIQFIYKLNKYIDLKARINL